MQDTSGSKASLRVTERMLTLRSQARGWVTSLRLRKVVCLFCLSPH